MDKKYIVSSLVILAIIILVGGLFLIGGKMYWERETPESSSFLSINNTIINLEIADTVDEQALGLSGRESLPKNQALLFVFEKSDQWGFWMKDMNFSIDMMWLDKNFKVVYIKKNADPASYPEVYTNTTPALYVLETYSGFVDDYKIKIGDRLDFTLEK